MYFVLTDLEWFDRQRGEKYIDVTWWIWLMHFSPSALAAVACTPLPCQVAERCFWLSLEARLGVLGMSPRKGYCRRHRKIQDPFTIVCGLPSFRMNLYGNLLCSRIQQHSCQAQGWFVLMSNHRRLGVEIHRGTAESLTAEFFTNRGDELGKATCCRILRPCGNPRAERRICMPHMLVVFYGRDITTRWWCSPSPPFLWLEVAASFRRLVQSLRRNPVLLKVNCFVLGLDLDITFDISTLRHGDICWCSQTQQEWKGKVKPRIIENMKPS